MTAALQPIPLLMTKLFVPRAQTDAVIRPRVINQLEAGLRRRLTLISAPAGFGKTTLVSNWRHLEPQEGVAVAWLSLDEYDNDAGRFLTYLIEALHRASPDIGANARALMQSAPGVQMDLIMTGLINDIGALPGQFVLVLDDYHLINNQQIHSAMEYLIEHMPPQLHVILICRADPPLPLAKWRARGEMVDIRATDLRFTIDETENFLQSSLSQSIDHEDIVVLEQRTEGWVAGLQLAAISMRDRSDIHTFIHSFSGQHRHIFDYLVDEVLDHESPETQEFLLQSSLFRRFTADLCNQVTDRRDSHLMLEYLERSNLFIASLDNERRWFRYHQLFADLLRRRLHQTQPDIIPNLHRRASIWFEEHGDPVEAAWQAIAGEDWDRASRLIETYEQALFNQGRSKTILELTEAVPDAIVLSRPRLLSVRGWTNILNGRPQRSWRDLAALGNLLGEMERDPLRSNELSGLEWRLIRGSLASAQAMNAILENDFQATLELANEALQQLPEDQFEMRAMTTGLRAQSFWLSGDLQSSAEDSQETVKLSQLTNAPLFQIIGLLSVASIDAEWGRFDRAAQVYRQAIEYADSRGLSMWQFTGRVMSFQSEVPYERNNLEEALEIAKRGREVIHPWSVSHAYDISYLHLARVHFALGDFDSARAVLDQAPPYSNLGPGLTEVAQVEGLQALIDIATGEREHLEAIEHELLAPMSDLLDSIWLWTPALRFRGQVLNALGRHADAVSILAPLFDICIDRGWTRQAVQVGSDLSVSHAALGDQDAAATTFERVLERAEPNGFIRSILDAGAGIESVISSALAGRAAEGNASNYLNRLLQLSREESRRQPAGPAAQHELIEPLSDREIEVLRLIAAGHTNAAIADELFVVVGTVKAHAHNIYSKLGVRNRTQAVNRARDLRIID